MDTRRRDVPLRVVVGLEQLYRELWSLTRICGAHLGALERLGIREQALDAVSVFLVEMEDRTVAAIVSHEVGAHEVQRAAGAD